MKLQMKILLLFVMVVAITLGAKAGENSIILKQGDLKDMKITRETSYDGDGLFGYINGGAELYLEYGFERVYVQEVMVGKEAIKIDIYKMHDVVASFGIFSINRNNCSTYEGIARNNCKTAYHLQFCVSGMYVSIVNTSGSKNAQDISYEIAKLIYERSGKECFVPPADFNLPELSNYIGKLKYISGRLGLQNGYPNWSDLLSDYVFSAYILPLDDSTDEMTLALIEMENSQKVEGFLLNGNMVQSQKDKTIFTANNKVAKLIRGNMFLYAEYDKMGSKAERILKAMNIDF
jgi:hypothetical protein